MKNKDKPLQDLLKREESIEVPHKMNSSFKIFFSKSLNFNDIQSRSIQQFVSFCYEALELKDEYTCKLVDDREKFFIMTTAACDFDLKEVRIYCRGRALADILRSISHEMSHLKQHEAGLYPIEEIGKFLHHKDEREFQANSMAGSLLSLFADKVGKNIIYDN